MNLKKKSRVFNVITPHRTPDIPASSSFHMNSYFIFSFIFHMNKSSELPVICTTPHQNYQHTLLMCYKSRTKKTRDKTVVCDK